MGRLSSLSSRAACASLAIVSAALTYAPPPAQADPLEIGGDSVSLKADQLDIDVMAGDAVLTGKVTLSKGELTVTCPRLEVRFDHTPQVTWAKGSGGVSADLRGVHAEAPSADLDIAHQVLELRGGVKLTRGQGFLTAETARIALGTGKVTLTQVKGVLPTPTSSKTP